MRQAAENHGCGMRRIQHRGDARDLPPIRPFMFIMEMPLVMVVLRFAIDEIAHFAGRHFFTAENGACAIVACLAHGIGQASLSHKTFDLKYFLYLTGDWHGAVDVLPRLQCLDDQRPVKMALHEDGDGVEFRIRYRIFKRRNNRHIEQFLVFFRLLRNQIAHGDIFHIGMLLEQWHETTAKLPATDKTNTDFSSHANSLFNMSCKLFMQKRPFIPAVL